MFRRRILHLSNLWFVPRVAQVREAYQAVAAARQRKKSPSKKERDAAWKALKDRDSIIKLLDSQ